MFNPGQLFNEMIDSAAGANADIAIFDNILHGCLGYFALFFVLIHYWPC